MEVHIHKTYQVGNKTYFSLREAKQALVEVNAVAKLRELLRDAILSSQTRCGNIDNVLVCMLEESDGVRAILAEYGKRKARKKPKVEA